MAIPPPHPELTLESIPQNVREELDLFADATLQIQRVKLLQERGVQRKLGLTAAQISAVSTAQREVDSLGATLQRLKPEEREAKLRNEFRPKAAEFRQLVDQQLTATQSRQLFGEVLRRQRGAVIFLLPGVPEEVQLTDRQKAHIYRMIDDTRNSVDLNQLYNPLVLARLVMRANAARKSAEANLTPEQRRRFDQLLKI